MPCAKLPVKLNWSTVISRYLFPQAVGISESEAAKLKDWKKLAPLLLKQKYELPPNVGSTMAKVLPAIVCKELGFPKETTLVGLLDAVLCRLLGADHRLTKTELAEQLPLFETGLTNRRADTFRRKLVHDWLTKPAGFSPEEEPQPPEPFDLPAFAATVRALAARSPAADRFHDNKVFIAPLWRASQREPAFPQMTLDEFKQRLLEANAQHLLHLSRADMVQAMDPRLVAESEIKYLNATFHFVLLEEVRP
jgi:hypothetical protein